MEEDGFILVSRKRRGTKAPRLKYGADYITRHKLKSVSPPAAANSDQGETALKRIREFRESLVSSEFYRGVQDVLRLISREEEDGTSAVEDGTSGQSANASSSNDAEQNLPGELVREDGPGDPCTAGSEKTGVERSPCQTDSEDHARKNADPNSDLDRLCSALRSSVGLGAGVVSLSNPHSDAAGEVSDRAGRPVPGLSVGRVQSVVCYGLGNFVDCKSAGYQLALLMLLCECLKISPSHCHVFDPMFSSVEQGVLQQMGFDVMLDNEEAKRVATTPTLFYMLHCCTPLYNNLLWANWSEESLPDVCIIGNSFNSFHDRMCRKTLQREEFRFINQIIPHTVEIPLKDVLYMRHVFNDTSLHVFPQRNLRTLPGAFWERGEEPQYDLEE